MIPLLSKKVLLEFATPRGFHQQSLFKAYAGVKSTQQRGHMQLIQKDPVYDIRISILAQFQSYLPYIDLITHICFTL